MKRLATWGSAVFVFAGAVTGQTLDPVLREILEARPADEITSMLLFVRQQVDTGELSPAYLGWRAPLLADEFNELLQRGR